jgi:4-hydroxy-2-oxoheptanedioate aldolase
MGDYAMDMPINRFKRALASGQRQIGIWSSSGSPAAVEMIAHAGFDWVLLDTEHAPNELPDIMHQMRAMMGSTPEPIVRPAWNDLVLLKRFLDAGAQTLLIPFVQNEEEGPRGGASHALSAPWQSRRLGEHPRQPLRACHGVLPPGARRDLRSRPARNRARPGAPGGHRRGGWGRRHLHRPLGSCRALGHLGNPGHPEVQTAIRSAIERSQAAGKPAGILAPSRRMPGATSNGARSS